jgi:hypothetical protein
MTSIEGIYIKRVLVKFPNGQYKKEYQVEPKLD